MTPDVFVAMASFAFVMAFTPGPNNVMLTASAVNFRFSSPKRGQIIVYSLVAIDANGATVVAVDGVRVVIPTETPTTTAKPVETTLPKESGVTITVK